MAKSIRFVFVFLLAFIFVIGMGSANSFIVTGELTKNATHGTTIEGHLTINNTNSTMNFSSVIVTSETPGLTITSGAFGSLNYSQTRIVSYSINIPSGTSPGNSNYQFRINGTNGTSSLDKTQIEFIVLTVASSPSLFVQSKTISENQNQTRINVSNRGNINLFAVSLNATNSSLVRFSVLDSLQDIPKGSWKEFIVNVDSSSIGSSRVGIFDNTLTATNGTVSATGTLSIEKGYCRHGDVGTLIGIGSIRDMSSGDDWEWEPLKAVRIRVEDVYNGADSRKTITVKLGFYDSNGRSVWLSTDERELEQSTRIASEEGTDFNFEFILPADLKRNEKYRLFVKAYDRESEQCISVSEQIDIYTDKEVTMDKLELPSILTCGSTNTISLRVHNFDLGDEEKMRVNIYNQDLGLNIYSDKFEIDEGDSEYIYFNFAIPENKEAKPYRIAFYAEYDYSESSDTFRRSENLGTYTIRLEGNKCKPTNVPTISATLDSETETMVGKELVVRITISNLGNASSFIMALEGFDSWAKSAKLDQTTFNIGAGESKTIVATFNPTRSGNQEFVVKAIYGGRVIEQRVNVYIAESTKWLSRIYNLLKTDGNASFWLTIAIFIVLILIIVVLLVKFVNSSKRE